jgi:hypothetical protein
MVRPSHLCAVLLASVSIGVRAQTPQWLPATHLDATHVAFLIDDFPWRDAAPPALRQLEGSVPDAARRRELEKLDNGYGAVLGFNPPVPNRLRSRHHLLIHAGGATRLRLEGLHGSARVDAPAGQPIAGVTFYGEARAATLAGHRGGGGFVVSDARTRTATISPSRYTADELLAPVGGTYFARGTSFWNVLTQFTFTLDGDKTRYVFVQWAADTDVKEGGCEYRFSLFRLEPAPAQIASSNYGCDV